MDPIVDTMNSDPNVWTVAKLLSEETDLGHQLEEYTSPAGFHHLFISAKSSKTGQVANIARHINRQLHRYHRAAADVGPIEPGEIWLHGIGPQAITRTIELALHLQHNVYPGHLDTSVQTSTCSTIRQVIAAIDPDAVKLIERKQPKSNVHIRLRLLPTRSKIDASD